LGGKPLNLVSGPYSLQYQREKTPSFPGKREGETPQEGPGEGGRSGGKRERKKCGTKKRKKGEERFPIKVSSSCAEKRRRE